MPFVSKQPICLAVDVFCAKRTTVCPSCHTHTTVLNTMDERASITDTNGDEWLSQIENSVQKKLKEDEHQWKSERWSQFVKEVVWWLHDEKREQDDVTIDTAAGLIKYGITNQEKLINVADTKKEFRDALKSEGILPAICDSLYSKYVGSRQESRIKPASPTSSVC